MENLALYRKYRPQNFNEVIGQDQVVSVLAPAIAKGNIAHAYLLTGPRGTGKTTIARLIAKEIGTKAVDIYEMDAASNRGIDDIRELKENVYTLPFDSKYKVYIIDEVHMLTKDAFNALLKTIEEPPHHVIFILATTELEKVLDTIVSRCQTFNFKKPSDIMLRDMVIRVATAEGYKISPSSASLLALLGDGSFRDTQGMLQKILSFSKDKVVDESEVERVTGAPQSSRINNIITAIGECDTAKALALINESIEMGISVELIFKILANKLRLILMVRAGVDIAMLGDMSEDDEDFLKNIVKTKSLIVQSKGLEILLEYYMLQKSAPISSIPLELFVVRMGEEMGK